MTVQVLNPYDGNLVVEIPHSGEVDAGVETALDAQVIWSGLEVDERIDRIRAGLSWFNEHAEEVARSITLQMGKPIVQSRGELKGLHERAEYMMSIAPDALAPEVLPAKSGYHRRIEHDPLGLVFNIAAWNYPLLIAVNVVVPALLSGNAVILKHSAMTPLCGWAFEEAFGRMDPQGLVKAVVLDHEATAALIEDPRINHVSFTGSVEGGRAVYASAARNLIDAGLELGGKDPAYVAEDADLVSAVEGLVDGACYNAGQSCCAVERAYVHGSLYEAFLEKARELMEGYRWGDPLDESTTLGPMARRESLDELEAQVKDAVDRGARLLLGGHRDGVFFPPTLLADVPPDAQVMIEESFGPILPVARVTGDDEAVDLMNDTRFGLTASVWTTRRDRAEYLADMIDAGTVYQNRCDFLDPALPWTGFGESGIGSTLSSHGFRHLTRRKSIHFRDTAG